MLVLYQQTADDNFSANYLKVNGLSAEQLAAAITVHEDRTTPLSAQQLVEPEARDWWDQWATSEAYDDIEWPDSANHPPMDMIVDSFSDACVTFPESTGLGWDVLHPRGLRRVSRELLYVLVVLLTRCEKVGGWPAPIRLIIIVLLPKSDGGFRPIGLLPLLPRV